MFFIIRAKRIFEGEKGLRFINGKLNKIFGPGLHFEFNFLFRQCRIETVKRIQPISTECCSFPYLIKHKKIEDKIVKFEVSADSELYFNGLYIKDLSKGNHYFWKEDSSCVEIKPKEKKDAKTSKSATISYENINTKDGRQVAFDLYYEYKLNTAVSLDFEEKELPDRIKAYITKKLLPLIGSNDGTALLRIEPAIMNNITADIVNNSPAWLEITDIVISKTRTVFDKRPLNQR